MRFTRTATALASLAIALGGLAACNNGDDDVRETAAPTTAESTTAEAVPTAEELTDLLNRASDPNIPVEEKVNLVQGGAEAPELFDEIARLKTENNANIQVTGTARGDFPGTAIGSVLIQQPEQQDINLEAQFVQIDGQWQLEKNFACALITNSGLQAPPTCNAGGAPMEGAPADGAPAEGAPMDGAPAEGAPMEGAPAEGAPMEGAPAEGAPAEGAPA